MKSNETAKKILKDLDKSFKEMIASTEIDDFYGHFCAELRTVKRFREYNIPGALSEEKIAALEKAVEEFKMVYEAEKAEAEKMPLSRHEAARVQKLFDEADEFQPLPDAPPEH